MVDEVVTQDAPAVDTETAAPAPAPAPKPVERNKGDERFGELTYRLKQAEATIAKLSEPKPVEKPDLVKPTLEQSGHDQDEYQAALDRYNEELIERRVEDKVAKALEARETKAKAQTRDELFSVKLGKLSEADKTRALSAQVTDVMAELIKESDVGIEVLLHLEENPEIANEIAKLPERLQARELGKLEAKLEKPTTAPVLKTVTVSKAPPPAAKIDASEPSSSISTTDPESDKLSDDAWVKAEGKRLAKRVKK